MVSFFSEEKMTIVNLDLPILSQKQQEEEDQEQERDQDHNQDEHWQRYPMTIIIPNMQYPELIILQALHPPWGMA